MGNPSRTQKKIGSMAAKGVLCLVLLSGLGLALAVSEPIKPPCHCFNPFLGTADESWGNSYTLCGSSSACYVDCNADCSDIQKNHQHSMVPVFPRLLVRMGSAVTGSG